MQVIGRTPPYTSQLYFRARSSWHGHVPASALANEWTSQDPAPAPMITFRQRSVPTTPHHLGEARALISLPFNPMLMHARANGMTSYTKRHNVTVSPFSSRHLHFDLSAYEEDQMFEIFIDSDDDFLAVVSIQASELKPKSPWQPRFCSRTLADGLRRSPFYGVFRTRQEGGRRQPIRCPLGAVADYPPASADGRASDDVVAF